MKFSRTTRALCTLGLASLLSCTQSTFAARLVDVAIINRTTGERLTTYRHDGKLYVAGSPGDTYSIELRSKRGERALTVLSVDGVNVLTGQTAATSQSGYVVDAYQTYAISGWRKSMDDVAKFVFTSLSDSYAARTGRPANVGVIGVAVYREKVPPPSLEPMRAPAPASAPFRMESGDSPADSSAPREQAAKASSALGSSSGELNAEAMREKKLDRLGTGHGEREYAPTQYTEFVRASDTPDEVIAIYYDSRPNLIALGIIRPPRLADHAPSPFPAGTGFVPDPRG